MANQQRFDCFVCDRRFLRNQLARIDLDDNDERRAVAIARRDGFGRAPQPINELTRLCLNCNRIILEEIRILQEDPHHLRLNVLYQTSYHTCLFCNRVAELMRLSLDARVNVYMKRNIYIPDNVKSCRRHLNEYGYILPDLIDQLAYINRPYVLGGNELLHFLDQLREKACNPWGLQDETTLSTEDFRIVTPVDKVQFDEMFALCVPVERNDTGFRYVSRKDLLTFLCKMKQGLSDDFLKVVFSYSSRQAVSLAVSTVRCSLMMGFVPRNVGTAAITREAYIRHHVPAFANALYNPNPDIPRAIGIIDGTYAYIDKSSNYQGLRKSFCMHKHRHLVKPIVIVAPDGYILDVQGPYFSNFYNNDARILIDQLDQNLDNIANWFQDGDVFLVDRGYRDALPLLARLGIRGLMPPVRGRGEAQLSTEDANASRLITKCRWVVESRNGHFKSIFKFLDHTIEQAHVVHLREFFLISAAILNRFHPQLLMQGADEDLARSMLERSEEPNIIQARVEVENLKRRRGDWVPLNAEHVPEFPQLSEEQLRELTYGTYQIKLARSYVQDKMSRDRGDEFQLDRLMLDDGFIRVSVYSRYQNRRKHVIFIAFDPEYRPGADQEYDIYDIILGYYCTCPAGARTLGCCGHVASIIWFLGYARHQQNITWPNNILLDNVLDAQ